MNLVLIHEWENGRLYVGPDGSLWMEYQLHPGIWLWYEVKYLGEEKPN